MNQKSSMPAGFVKGESPKVANSRKIRIQFSCEASSRSRLRKLVTSRMDMVHLEFVLRDMGGSANGEARETMLATSAMRTPPPAGAGAAAAIVVVVRVVVVGAEAWGVRKRRIEVSALA